MSDSVIENVIEQNKIHREIGYLEGLADAYRDMSLTRGRDLPALEKGLDALLKTRFEPPF